MWVDALSAILLPTVGFALVQLRLRFVLPLEHSDYMADAAEYRSFYDFNVAFWGNIWGLATTSLFQVTIKTVIG